MNTFYYASPLGVLKIIHEGQTIFALDFVKRKSRQTLSFKKQPEQKIAKQLDEYFCSQRTTFQLELAPSGTSFQLRVFQKLCAIPFGKTVSYGQLAKAIGQPQAAQAVGQAVRNNPIALIIPCHRVIGSNGKLIGFAGGLWRKKWLLKHERVV